MDEITDNTIEQTDEEIAKQEAKLAKFAIHCRKVRMFVASNPGCTSAEIKEKIGGRYDMALSKMMGMGIVKMEKNFNEMPKWFVIPQ